MTPDPKTVPHLHPESDIIRSIFEVFAVGIIGGNFERACVELIRPSLDDSDSHLEIYINILHEAQTLPKIPATVITTQVEVYGRKLTLEIIAGDRGQHRWPRAAPTHGHQLSTTQRETRREGNPSVRLSAGDLLAKLPKEVQP